MAQMATLPPERPRPRIRGPVLTLVVMPSRRGQFFANLRVALMPGGKRLQSEVNLGLFSGRGISASTFLHTAVIALWLMLPKMFPEPRVVAQREEPPKDDIVYYEANALPEMDDSAGSRMGHSGRPGGQEAFHPTQVIRVSRGPALVPVIVDEPKPSLPRIDGAAANLLSLAAAPAPATPVLAPAPVTVPVERRDSRIAMPAAPAAKPNLRLAAGTVPELAPMPTSTVAKARSEEALTLPPRPLPSLPRHADVEVAASSTSELSMNPLQPVPPPSVGEPAANGSGGPMKTETVVISTNSGEAVGAPVNGTLGSLAMSPKGHPQPGVGGEGGGAATARGTGPGSGAAAAGPGSGSSGAGPGSSPAASGGISVARGSGGSGNNGIPAIPGVVIRGGVVTLGSFGPKTVPDAKPSTTAQPRKAAAITVIATPRSGGGLNAYGAFKNQQVYTIYLDTKAGPVVLQFAGRETAAAYNGNLTPPDPYSTEMPPLPAGAGVVLSGILDEAGHVQNVRLMRSALQSTQALLEAVRNWQFHPALRAGQPVAVDVLIGIGVGVR